MGAVLRDGAEQGGEGRADPWASEVNAVGAGSWKDASAYEHLHTKTDILIWRWEFLRRREDYRADWEKYRGTDSERINSWIKTSLVRVVRTGADLVATPETLGANSIQPPPREFASHDEYLLALIRAPAAATPSQLASMPGSIKHYGMRFLVDPEISSSQALLGPAMLSIGRLSSLDRKALVQHGTAEDVLEELQQFEAKLRRFRETQPSRHYLIGIDLSRPVAEILRTLAVTLPIQQKFYGVKPRTSRLRPEKWALYLRALDAKACGQSLATIAQELLGRDGSDPESDHALAHETIDAAKRIQDKLTR